MALVAANWGQPGAWLMAPTVAVAIAAAAVDIREGRIPNRLTAAALGALGMLTVIVGLVFDIDVIGGAFIGANLFALPLLICHILTSSRSPGLGDVKLAGVLGLTLGAIHPFSAYSALILSLLIGALYGIISKRRTGRRNFPLAPGIAAGTVLTLAIWPVLGG